MNGEAAMVATSESEDERNGCNVTLPLDMTSGRAVNKVDNGAGLASNRQINWLTANGAVFD